MPPQLPKMSKKNIKAINSLGMVITSVFLKDKDVEKLREAKKYFEKTYELDKDNGHHRILYIKRQLQVDIIYSE